MKWEQIIRGTLQESTKSFYEMGTNYPLFIAKKDRNLFMKWDLIISGTLQKKYEIFLWNGN